MSDASRPRAARQGTTTPDTATPDTVSVVMAGAVSAALVALIGIALGLIATMGSWALAAHSDDVGPEEVARVSVALWLWAQHVPIEIGGVRLGIVPLGLMLIPAALCYAGGRQVARVVRPRSVADVVRAVIPYALVYGLLAAVAAGIVRSEVAQPAARTAFFCGVLIAGVAGGFGLLRAGNLLQDAVLGLPRTLRDLAAAATTGVAVVVLVSAVLTAIALAIGFSDAVEMYRSLDAGWSGGIALVILTVAFVPNLVFWTASFTTGVGFLLGSEGSVSPQGVEYGPLPVFPPLAALPPEGDAGGLAFIALLAPLLAGYAIGAVVHKRSPEMRVEQLAGRAALAGAAAGVALGVLAWLSAGSAGSDALDQLGPIGWKVGLVAGLELSLVAAVVAWELHRRGGTRRPRLIDLRDKVTVPSALTNLTAKWRSGHLK
ncbi:MAG TPA: DUF6350 family protein [Actinomycetes bacterium]|nr:DUF6350 family protein [Actinomycetes bacterium]